MHQLFFKRLVGYLSILSFDVDWQCLPSLPPTSWSTVYAALPGRTRRRHAPSTKSPSGFISSPPFELLVLALPSWWWWWWFGVTPRSCRCQGSLAHPSFLARLMPRGMPCGNFGLFLERKRNPRDVTIRRSRMREKNSKPRDL